MYAIYMHVEFSSRRPTFPQKELQKIFCLHFSSSKFATPVEQYVQNKVCTYQYVLTYVLCGQQLTFERLIVKYTMFYQSMTNVKPVNREALLFQQQLCSLQVVLQL